MTRVVRLNVGPEQARKIREYVTRAQRALPKETANVHMHVWLQLLAADIEQAQAKTNVVPLRPRPDGPEAA